MRQTRLGLLLTCLLTVVASPDGRAADAPEWTRTQDVIYGRKYGLALTMDVFTPKKDANGAAARDKVAIPKINLWNLIFHLSET